MDALERVSGGRRDGLACADATGQRDHADPLVANDLLAGLAGAQNDVEGTFGKVLLHHLGEPEC
ncbi:unannotated protein [freshwater metagenome]|uniref:Unannotated protein n=1 Tax=freshwater metagenome TaxID=449393 RepID=A0A6J5ZXY4_9ZZZZ